MKRSNTKVEFWNFDKEKVLTGCLVGKLSNVGTWKKRAFVFETEDGRTIRTWAYVNLVNDLMHAPFGTWFKITYEGNQPDPASGHFTKMFNIVTIEKK